MAKKSPTATGDCSTCGFKKGMANPTKGKKLPGGGKCTRCEGPCEAVKKEKGPSPLQTERFKGIMLALGAEELGVSCSAPDMGDGQEKDYRHTAPGGRPRIPQFRDGVQRPLSAATSGVYGEWAHHLIDHSGR